MDQLAETRDTCLTHKKEDETEVARWNDLASYGILLQRKTAHKLEHTADALNCLAASLITAHQKGREVFKERGAFLVKLEQANRADGGMSTSEKKIVKKLRSLLARACEATLQFKMDHEK